MAFQNGEPIKLFRAVSRAELEDVHNIGRFRPKPGGGSLESKQFATTAEDAARFGRDHFLLDGETFYLLEIEVPKSVADQFEHLQLDFKPAVNVPEELFPLLNRNATIREVPRIPLE